MQIKRVTSYAQMGIFYTLKANWPWCGCFSVPGKEDSA